MNDKISIIVPVYNTQDYLKKCIDSIIKQTYSNLEIIIINDGSTDESKKICEEYLTKDSRIIFINKKNTGVSDTRNLGLSIATGKYIGFVDSDDYIERDMFKKLYKNIIKYNADISICSFKSKEEYKEEYKEILMSCDEIFKLILEDNGPNGFLWNKLYKKSIIKENNIKFQENILICEDLLFNCNYLNNTKRAIYTNDKLYNYINRENSACNEKFNYKWISLLEAYDIMKKIYEKKSQDVYDCFKVSYVLTNINIKTKMYLAKVKNNEIKQRCNNVIKCYIKEIFKSPNISFKIKLKVFCYNYFHNIINLLKKIKMIMKF